MAVGVMYPKQVEDKRTAWLNAYPQRHKPHLIRVAGWWYCWDKFGIRRGRAVGTAFKLWSDEFGRYAGSNSFTPMSETLNIGRSASVH
jgi:hypothetical protein